MMGMTEEQYWRGDPYLAVSYRKAHELKTSAKNYDAWWQGFYIQEAVGAVLSPKGKFKYPKEPHELTVREEKKPNAKQEREKAKAYLDQIKAALEQKYGRSDRNINP